MFSQRLSRSSRPAVLLRFKVARHCPDRRRRLYRNLGNGRVGRRFSLLDAVHGPVNAAALWLSIDLDYPTIGIVRVSNLPLVVAMAGVN